MANAGKELAHRLTGTVDGTIVAAGVLAVSSADEAPAALDTGLYVLATVVVFWLAHGWAHQLGQRAGGRHGHRLIEGLHHELPVLEAAAPPLAGLALARLLGGDAESAITVAIWVCVGELALLGAWVARREGSPPLQAFMTAAGCAALGLVMVGLKAFVH